MADEDHGAHAKCVANTDHGAHRYCASAEDHGAHAQRAATEDSSAHAKCAAAEDRGAQAFMLRVRYRPTVRTDHVRPLELAARAGNAGQLNATYVQDPWGAVCGARPTQRRAAHALMLRVRFRPAARKL